MSIFTTTTFASSISRDFNCCNLNPSFCRAYFCPETTKYLTFYGIEKLSISDMLGMTNCDMYFQVKVIDTVEVFIGWEWEARILERFCEYTVDGVPGWGVSEWHYRHFGGRPQKYEDQDPPEVKDVPKY